MGSPDDVGHPDEHPRRLVDLPAFCIDRTEVTVAAFRACAQAGGCPAAPSTVHWQGATPEHVRLWSTHCNAGRQEVDQHPINCVDWTQADTYCRWKGGRLPTEAEWESAARGPDGNRFPWGNEDPSVTRVNAFDDRAYELFQSAPLRQGLRMLDTNSDGWAATAPVGSFPAGASPLGLLDLAGNVWEWTADGYGPYDASTEGAATRVGSGPWRVRRGGGWATNDSDSLRTTARSRSAPDYRSPFVGFRCAHSLGTAPIAHTEVPSPEASAIPRSELLREAVLAGVLRNDPSMGGAAYLRPPISILAGPWTLQERSALSPTVAALVDAPTQGAGTDRCTWLVSVALEAPEVRSRTTELGCGARRPVVTDVLVRDVDANGRDELVILTRASIDASAQPEVHVYSPDFDVGEASWLNLTEVELLIHGSHDAASVDAALASRGRDDALAEGISAERLIARLSRATPAGFRSMIAASGLRMCDQPPGQTRPRCRTLPAARLQDAQVVALQHRYFALQWRSGTDQRGFHVGSCRQGPSTTVCEGGEYTGNVTLHWTITGAGPSMRLAGLLERYDGN
jgi:formylglycine-generating enzyme required for sulfatase activity